MIDPQVCVCCCDTWALCIANEWES
jgi:hypothetical protein